MKNIATLPNNLVNEADPDMSNQLNENLSLELADSIRAISEMINRGSDCDSIAAAAVQCSLKFLPGANAMMLLVDTDAGTATVMAGANAAFVRQGQQLPLKTTGFLADVLAEPKRVHCTTCDADNKLFAERVDFADEPNDTLVCKAVPREAAERLVLVLLTDDESVPTASTVLMALSELLIALCTAHSVTAIKDHHIQDIARAKKEWERTVDALPEIVCLVDRQGRIVRSAARARPSPKRANRRCTVR